MPKTFTDPRPKDDDKPNLDYTTLDSAFTDALVCIGDREADIARSNANNSELRSLNASLERAYNEIQGLLNKQNDENSKTTIELKAELISERKARANAEANKLVLESELNDLKKQVANLEGQIAMAVRLKKIPPIDPMSRGY